MKRAACAALVAGILATAGSAQAADRICKGEAKVSETLASVDVEFRVDDYGKIVSREANWSPGSATGGLGMITGEPTVTISYDNVTEQGLGAATGIDAFSMAMTNDGRLFAGSAMVFELPDGRSWRDPEPTVATGTGPNGQVTFVMAMGDLEPSQAPDLFADLEQVGQARVSFRRGDQSLKTVTIDLRGRQQRDELFRTAWASAVKAAEKPRKCEKARD